MKFLQKSKDGGPESTVTAYWLVEIKWLFSIAILRFDNGSRDNYHSHAFHSISWLLKGLLFESLKHSGEPPTMYSTRHWPSRRVIVTKRDTFHRVESRATSWVLTFRGPWSRTWQEWDPKAGKLITLTHGRRIVS